jgi:hypothetical protein
MSPANDAAASAEVTRAVEAWAKAWSSRDVDLYAASYAPDFHAGHSNHAEWLAQRRSRIGARRQIEIALSDVVVKAEAGRAEVRFVQMYRGDQTRLTDRKRLLLTRSPGGKWLIHEEATL